MDRQCVILVVDDDRSVRKSTLRLLIARGYIAVEAANAAEAIAKAVERAPDVILMDLHLEQTSGVEAARQLKAVDSLKNIPIIAISASPPSSQESLQLFVRLLLKPCPSKDVIEAIEAALPPTAGIK